MTVQEFSKSPMKGSLAAIQGELKRRGFTCVKKGKEDFWTRDAYFAEIVPRANKELGYILTIRRSTYF